MKHPWRRLAREETGQVLVLTLAMLGVLVLFTLGLCNVIFLGITKVRAQHAADNLALSAATLKARVLNQMTNINGVLEQVVMQMGRIHYSPYASEIDMSACVALGYLCNGWMLYEIANYWRTLPELNRISEENGLDPRRRQFRLAPYVLSIGDFTTEHKSSISYMQNVPLPPKMITLPVAAPNHKYEPKEIKDWYVQSRVEWPIQEGVVGGRLLGIRLPDIVTRARAEVYDAAAAPLPWTHSWKVRLVQPDEAADQYLKHGTGTW